MDFFHENLKTLLNFKNTEWMEIKSYYGKLEGTDSWKQVGGYWGGGTVLQGTVKVIGATCDRFMREFNEFARESPEVLESEKGHVRTYFQQLDTLIETLEHILKLYQEKHRGDSEYPGLGDLGDLIERMKIARSRQRAAMPFSIDQLLSGKEEEVDLQHESYYSSPHDFARYLDVYNSSLPHSAAYEYRRLGVEALKDLCSFKRIVTDTDPTIARRQAASLVWALMAKAIEEKGQGFAVGTFLLQDPGTEIYKYLASLGEKYVAPFPVYEKRAAPIEGAAGMQYAFDFLTTPLPAENRAIVFNLIDEGTPRQATFIKLLKEPPMSRRGNHGSRIGSEVPSSSSDPHTRLEGVPKELRAAYLTLDSSRPLDVESEGLHLIDAELKNLSPQRLVEIMQDQQLLEAYKVLVKGLSEYDHLHLRTGREVIFTPLEQSE